MSCCWAAGSWRLRRHVLKVWFLRFSGREPSHRKWCCGSKSWWPSTPWSVANINIYSVCTSVCFKCQSVLIWWLHFLSCRFCGSLKPWWGTPAAVLWNKLTSASVKPWRECGAHRREPTPSCSTCSGEPSSARTWTWSRTGPVTPQVWACSSDSADTEMDRKHFCCNL